MSLPLAQAGLGPLAQLDGVSFSYGTQPVLDAIDIEVLAGQFSGIVGPSGSGKTTLLKLLLGAVVPAAGTVRRRSGLRVGYVPQVDQINWSFPVTVEECVLMARTPNRGTGRRLPWPSRSERAEVHEALSRLGIEALGLRHIRELSGGQQQRVFIARALLGRPDLLLLDEPTSGVDVHTRHEILHLLDDLNHDGLAIVLSTHDLNGIASHLPHLVCLNNEIIGSGSPHDVLTEDVLERTFGARMSILTHAGMPLVVDSYEHRHPIQLDAVAAAP